MEKVKVQLSAADKLFLRQYISKGNHAARAIRRARMLLLLDVCLKNQKQIALDCNCSAGTVTNLLKRYAECKGVIREVLEEKPRSGQPTIITAELEANITALACCEQGPDGRSSWTLELMADKMVKRGLAVHLSYETVRKVLKKASLNPGLKSSGASLK
jgi:putative transposase